MINQQQNRTIPHWKAFRWNNDLHCLSQNTLGSTFLSQECHPAQARMCCQGPAILRKTQHRPPEEGAKDFPGEQFLFCTDPTGFCFRTPQLLTVVCAPIICTAIPSAAGGRVLPKTHKIQTDVTAESSHLLIGMRKGSRVKLILHFQLTNLELGSHRKSIHSKICSSRGRECAARAAPAVSEGLGSHLTLRAVPRATSAALLGSSSSGHPSRIQSCRRQEFISLQIFFLVVTWGEKKQVCKSYSQV